MSITPLRHSGFETVWDTTILFCHGTLTLQRRATTPEYRARLVHAAKILSCLNHPGIEGFITILDDPHATTLLTRYCGGRSLITATTIDATTVTQVFATLAELHASGITHGPLHAHQLRLVCDTPILCGFDDATARVGLDDGAWQNRCDRDVISAAHLLAGQRLPRRIRRVLAATQDGQITDAATVALELTGRRATVSMRRRAG